MARRLLWFSTKVGILSGTIYYTNEIGIWDDSKHTTQLLEDAINYVKPLLKDNIPAEIKSKPLPSMAEVSASSKTYWNKGVWNSSLFIADLPQKVVDWTTNGVKFITEQLKEKVEGKKEEN